MTTSIPPVHHLRSFSTLRTAATLPLSRTRSSLIPSSRDSIPWSQPCIRRSLTLFPWSKPTATPSPDTVAEIARLEAEANTDPNNAHAHEELFRALAATKTKAGYDLIMSRWERMCELVSPLLIEMSAPDGPIRGSRIRSRPSYSPTEPSAYIFSRSSSLGCSHLLTLPLGEEIPSLPVLQRIVPLGVIQQPNRMRYFLLRNQASLRMFPPSSPPPHCHPTHPLRHHGAKR